MTDTSMSYTDVFGYEVIKNLIPLEIEIMADERSTASLTSAKRVADSRIILSYKRLEKGPGPPCWTLCMGLTFQQRKKKMGTKQPRDLDKDGFTVDDPSKRNKDNDVRICTWNIRTLNRPRAAEQLAAYAAEEDIASLDQFRSTRSEIAEFQPTE